MGKHRRITLGYSYRVILLLTVIAVATIACFLQNIAAAEESIPIDKQHFPDDNFRAWCLNQTWGLDEVLTHEEILGIETITLPRPESNSTGIKSLKGIEFFTEIQTLDCHSNYINSLNIQQNTKLRTLDCSWNPLYSLDVSNNRNLESLDCTRTGLEQLDVGQNNKLLWLQCDNGSRNDINNNHSRPMNHIARLDVSHNPNLQLLSCGDNGMTDLCVSGATYLNRLLCSNNKLTALDVSHNPFLGRLECESNQIIELDLSQNTALGAVWCAGNMIPFLDLSSNNNLGLNNYLNTIASRSPYVRVNSQTLNAEAQLVGQETWHVDLSPFLMLHQRENVSFPDASVNSDNLDFDITTGIITLYESRQTLTYRVPTYYKGMYDDFMTVTIKLNEVIPINEVNFPDANFREWCLTQTWGVDRTLRPAEVTEILEINVANLGIGNLRGIEFFTKLRILDCSNNMLGKLDLSRNTALTTGSTLSNQILVCPVSAIQVSGGNYFIDMKQIVGEDECQWLTISTPESTWDPQTGILTVPSTSISTQYVFNTRSVNAALASMAVTLNIPPIVEATVTYTTDKSTYTIGEIISFIVSITDGNRVRLVVDGVPYDEYPATGNSFTVTRAFTSSGMRSVQFQVGDSASWGAMSEARNITVTAIDTLLQPVVDTIGSAYQSVDLVVDWQPVDHAEIYFGYLYHNGVLVWVSPMTTTNSMTIPAQALGTLGTHSFELIATAAGYDQSSSIQTFEVVEDPSRFPALGVPVIDPISLDPVEGNSFTVNWSAVANATSYQVTILNESGSQTFATTVTKATEQISGTTIPVKGQYTIKVKAIADRYQPSEALLQFNVISASVLPEIQSFTIDCEYATVNTDTVKLTVTAVNATKVQLFVDGRGYETYDIINPSTPIEIPHVFSSTGLRAIGFKAYGNGGWSSLSATQEIRIVKKLVYLSVPVYFISPIANSYLSKDTILVKWNSLGSLVRYRLTVTDQRGDFEFSWSNVYTGTTAQLPYLPHGATYTIHLIPVYGEYDNDTWILPDPAATDSRVEAGVTSKGFRVFYDDFNAEIDGFPFINHAMSFEGEGYYIPAEVYAEVFSNLVISDEQAQFFQHYDPKRIKNYEWGGNCFGMSLAATLFDAGVIDLRPCFQNYFDESISNRVLCLFAYTGIWKYEALHLCDVRKATEFIRLIERLQLSQHSYEFLYNTWPITDNDWERKEPGDYYVGTNFIRSEGEYDPVFDTLFNYRGTEPYIVSLCWYSDSAHGEVGHTVVLDTHKRPIWDPNDPDSYIIYIYNPNAACKNGLNSPAYSPDYIHFNTSTGTWYFGSNKSETATEYMKEGGDGTSSYYLHIFQPSIYPLKTYPSRYTYYFNEKDGVKQDVLKIKGNYLTVRGNAPIATIDNGAIIYSSDSAFVQSDIGIPVTPYSSFQGSMFVGRTTPFTVDSIGEASIYDLTEYGTFRRFANYGEGTAHVTFHPVNNSVTVNAQENINGMVYVSNPILNGTYCNIALSGVFPANQQVLLQMDPSGMINVSAPQGLRMDVTLYTSEYPDRVLIQDIEIQRINQINIWQLLRDSVIIITEQPQDQNVFVGQDASFSVDAQATSALHYQWYVKSVGAVDYHLLANATSQSLTIRNATLKHSGNQYYCKITINNGSVVMNTNAASLTVFPDPPRTGDHYPLTTYIVLIIISVGIVVLQLCAKKQSPTE